MLRTSWTGRNGAPQDIRALAQTPDGTLWVGSTAGLFSFDGQKFTAFEPAPGDPSFPSTAIRSLFVSSKGDLWVEGGFVGAARISRGHLTPLGDPGIRLFQIRQDSTGTIWGVRDYSQVVSLGSDDKWHPAANPLERPGYVSSLFIDSSDTQWVVEEGRLYRRPKGQGRFLATTITTDGQVGFAEGKDRDLWMYGAMLKGGLAPRESKLLHLDAAGSVLKVPRIRDDISSALALGDGTSWLALPAKGLVRLASQQTMITAPDELLTNAPHALLRDTEGDIWVGGILGLDRLQHATIYPETRGSNTGNWSTCTNLAGEVWVMSDDAPLAVIRDGVATTVREPDGYSKLYCTATGDVFFLDRLGIGQMQHRRFHQLPALPGHRGYGRLYNFISFVETRRGVLIASMGSAIERGLWKFDKSTWKPFAPRLFTGFAQALFADDSGQLYVGRTDGEIFRFNERDATLTLHQATDLGVISAFCPTAYGLFVVASNGIGIERSDGFHKLSFNHPEIANTVTGLVETGTGDVWINGSRGIVRLPAQQVKQGLQSQSYPIEGIEWKEGDYIGPALLQQPYSICRKR